MSTFTAIPLDSPTRGYRLTTTMSEETWRKHMVEMVSDFLNGKDVFIRYTGRYDTKRKGSIGRVKKFRNIDELINGRSHYHYRSRPSAPAPTNHKPPYNASQVKEGNMTSFYPELRWDGRTNKTNPHDYELEWLKDYTGPTDWKYEIPEEEKVEAVDRLGRELKVGDFICYVLHHFETTGASVRFGNVTKITPSGDVWAKNIKLSSDEHQADKKINDNSTIVILTKDLMDQLMMAKLSSL